MSARAAASGAVTTILEQDLSYARRRGSAVHYRDSVGIGMYRLDLHPRPAVIITSTLLRVRSRSRSEHSAQAGHHLLPAGRTSGTTHITKWLLPAASDRMEYR